ncbi:LysR family transcriptional regulator [Actinobacteria bacterium YIM 96077]|uniref:LysR family transcriptional regulator n=1 Tax=Phytoactinopolyspora halophila TaxID=1981511 RepID=A0A329QNX3_9ACTN|nr:LysR family transcriptional regulator [Phytoactinopolyspora halophila]AYY14547.1 LysR family transcriptional regulator [Actinobacteria bacterium YIM 96077]RAW14077.1 LysR family transcriptional regulator [Phytoactinopolyspora halophila]
MLDFQRLRVLREFARRGTIAATAQALGYTASAISQQLASLEREIGTALLDRHARSVELTDAGRRLLGHADGILSAVEAAESDVAAAAGEAAGQITVTAFPSAAVAFAPRLAGGLRPHRRVQLVLRQAAGAVGTRRVSTGDADVALAEGWSGSVPDSLGGRLRVRRLLRDPLVLAVPKRHRLADPERPVELAALLDESWIVAPPGEPSRGGIEQLLAPYGGAPAAAWEFEGQGTILSLVARGIGIAAVPSLALALRTGGVRFRQLPEDVPVRDIYSVVRTASIERPSVAVTLKVLADAATTVERELSSLLESRNGAR